MDGWMDEWLNRQSVLITVVWAFMNRGVLMKYERQPLTKISLIRSYRSSFYSLPYVTLYLHAFSSVFFWTERRENCE